LQISWLAKDDFIRGERIPNTNDGEANRAVICWPLAMTNV